MPATDSRRSQESRDGGCPVPEVERVFRAEAVRVLATLIRLLGDFDLAEDAAQDAFSAALEQWTKTGIPGNPRAWLVAAIFQPTTACLLSTAMASWIA